MKRFLTNTIMLCAALCIVAQTVTVDMARYGIRPDRKENMSPKLQKALADIKKKHSSGPVVLKFAKGKYNFDQKGAATREYYISNHDQDNPKTVAFTIEDWDNVTIDGQGADFYFHGHMVPVAILNSRNCTIKNFSIDFATPHIAQIEVLKNEADGITFRTAPWVNGGVDEKGRFVHSGDDWTIQTYSGIAFDGKTRHLVYRTSDLWRPVDSVVVVEKDVYRAPKWTDPKIVPGTVVALRSGYRPAPAVFLADDVDTRVENVKVHYCEGMGLLAQTCENISLDGFSVCLRGDDDPRYFTSNADATHYSGCKGKITSCNGLYEGMMDDAINVHGVYLRVVGRVDDRTIKARYLSPGSYGFKWGEPGDSIQLIRSNTMELLDGTYVIASIKPVDKPTVLGAKDFEISFTAPLDEAIGRDGVLYGIENLTWTPEVYFAGNVIRNNRARGSLFSTPKLTVVENNLFDHTSGTAILLCGDCNGWYETGSCRDVQIRNNRFINSLTNMFQFTEAVISIYPEIPDLGAQTKYFHGGKGYPGVVIENNEFVTFDKPILYAKSIDGLKFKNNVIRQNNDYPAFHGNRFTFKLQRARDVEIENNDFKGCDVSMSIRD